MTKIQFILSMHKLLAHLPQEELEERLRFYSEIIEDRMEEGMSEAEAVAAVGDPQTLAAGIREEYAAGKSEKKTKRKPSGWEICLLVLGFPLWFPLLAAAFAVAVSLYATLWSVIGSFWAVFVSLAVCALAGVPGAVILFIWGKTLTGLAVLGAGMVCAGVAIFAFFGCMAITKGTVLLTKKLFASISVRRKETAG